MKSVVGSALFFAGALLALDPPAGFRLPDDTVPRKYTVALKIDPAKPAFEGTIQIEVSLQSARNVVWLNAKGLSDLKATVATAGRSYPARTIAVDDEFLGLELPVAIGPGEATVSVAYRGELRESPTVGAFHTKFEDRWYAFTTFTAIDARRAFPCFDEPRFKTPWKLTLHIPQGDQAFSNAAQMSEEPEADGEKVVRFEPTGMLASEVVAFAVGPFSVLAGGGAGAKRVPVRILTPAGHAAEGATAAGITDAIMTGLEQYTGIPYPWEKLDDVALPQGAFGGVEQPGMITYRMRGLLSADPDRLRPLLTHELAHQWFGNTVTQATWRDVWLSEGFATWLTFHMTDPDHVKAIAARERIMAADAGPKTRPVRLELHNREEMKDVYSQFVYQKAGAILMMIEGWLGEDAFRRGLQGYLRAHRDGTATTDDLGDALGATAVLHNFLDRSGIPVVRAELRCETGKPPVLIVSASSGPVPVCWKGDGIGRRCAVFESGRHETGLDRCPSWIYPNAGGTGYYRSEFDTASVAAHLDQLTPAERLTFDYDLHAREKKPSPPPH